MLFRIVSKLTTRVFTCILFENAGHAFKLWMPTLVGGLPVLNSLYLSHSSLALFAGGGEGGSKTSREDRKFANNSRLTPPKICNFFF